MHFPSRRRKTQMKILLKAAMSYRLAQCLASLLKSTCVTHRRRVSLHIFHLWMKRKFTGKQPCQCPIYMRQQCKFSLFFPPECFKMFIVDFVSEIWAWNMSHTCCIGIFYTKGVIQCFFMGERRQRRFIVWAAHWWFELFIQTTLCQLFVSRKRKVTCWRLCLPGTDMFLYLRGLYFL